MVSNLALVFRMCTQAVESPDLNAASPQSTTRIYIANFIFSCIFVLEIIVKVAVHGFVIPVCSTERAALIAICDSLFFYIAKIGACTHG